ncbi:MAG TPA: hypothetical protein ENG42_01390 [Candidatus Aenigmarchaeota archaeon]|nr:MAG: hypothetical protein DRP03_01660 [Candidatus Aenigmarchaeota archaeon]HDD46104.1 hypothetical protein [Candidatus Aenigmarchaeota archaeon]
MPFGWGRGFRWWYYLTGTPGWSRASYPQLAFGRCFWYPWLPRWWWTGMYGRVVWTPQGPQLESQVAQTVTESKNQEIQALEQEKEMIVNEMKAMEERIKEIEKKLEELKRGKEE